MKKIALLALAFAGMAHAYAQPHTWLVYGSAGISQNTNNSSYAYPQGTTTNWSVTPGIGYQFNKHLTVGVQGSYSHAENPYPAPVFTSPYSNNSFFNGYGGTTINWSAGAFFRYTQNLGKIFYIYGQANMAYLSSELHNAPYYYYNSNTVIYSESTPTANGFEGQLFPAIGAKIYKGLALNFSLGGLDYNTISQNLEGGGNGKVSNVQLTFGQQVNIGVSDNFSFRKHHKHHHHIEAGSEYRHTEVTGADDDDDAPAPETQKKHKKEKHKEDE